MQITSDNFSLYLAAPFAGLACITSVVAGIRGETECKLARRLNLAAAVSFTYGLLYLLTQLLSGARYDLAYIFEFSGPEDALLYRFTALWAGQEGSLLVWTTFCVWTGVVLASGSRPAGEFVMSFWLAFVTVLGCLLLATGPFDKLADYRPGTVGLGLNPLLKNPWIAIHPPLVFLGYAALMATGAFAVAALVMGRFDDWARLALPWAVVGCTYLGAGIALGMVWSYEVLGWGGYWAWDPVENASLVPWLLGIALVHGILLQLRTAAMQRANLVLAAATFLTILYAAFLTRSGILSELSLHSFASGAAFVYWLWMLAGFTALLVFLLTVRWRDARAEPETIKIRTADAPLLVGIIGLSIFGVAVLIGTSVPLVTKAVIKPEFFNKMAAPLAALTLVSIVAATVLGSPKTKRTLSMQSARHVAHVGVALMIIGVVFSSASSSRKLTLYKNGSSRSALGYSFSFGGRQSGGKGREIVFLKGERAGRPFVVKMRMEYTERGSVRTPYIASGVFSDLYVSPIEIGGTEVMPTGSVTEEGWISLPATIPGTDAALTLMGMQVEQEMARLRYQRAGGRAVEFNVAKGTPARVNGIVVELRRLVVSSSRDMSGITAGVDLVVSGEGVPERAVVEVSIKPMVSFVWLGAGLVTLGLTLAAVRRVRESTRGQL